MPTTFAHDLFGKEVYKQLPDNIKKVIKENKSQFLIGLHGPDIFFYKVPFIKNPVNQLGYQLHKQEAARILEQGIKRYKQQPSKALLAYLLGFSCHHILDHSCHPYIGQFEGLTGISHSEIETHLDRQLMEQEGKDPFSYKPGCSICVNSRNNKVIHDLFPEVSIKDIRKSLKGLKFYTSVPVCKSNLKRKSMFALLKLLGCYDAMQGQIMKNEKNPTCEESTERLLKLYENAKIKAVPLVKNVFECCIDNQVLSVEFSYDFN